MSVDSTWLRCIATIVDFVTAIQLLVQGLEECDLQIREVKRERDGSWYVLEGFLIKPKQAKKTCGCAISSKFPAFCDMEPKIILERWGGSSS